MGRRRGSIGKGTGRVVSRRPPVPVSPRYLSVIDLVRQRARKGASDEQILEEVNRRLDRGLFEIDEDLALEDIRYLESLPSEASPLDDCAQ